MRLFVAIQLSEDMKKTMAGTLHDLKQKGVRGNYVPLQNMHLTLAFIGEVEDPRTVKEALSGISVKPFKLAFSDMGTFGDLLWVGIKGNQGLSALAKDIRGALDQNGIAYDKGNFTPHVTIIRKVSGAWQQAHFPKGEILVKRISLMKSEEKGGKRVYKEIFSI